MIPRNETRVSYYHELLEDLENIDRELQKVGSGALIHKINQIRQLLKNVEHDAKEAELSVKIVEHLGHLVEELNDFVTLVVKRVIGGNQISKEEFDKMKIFSKAINLILDCTINCIAKRNGLADEGILETP